MNCKLKISTKSGGFTLVELIVVVTIIAIMAVIMAGIFNSVGIFNKARDAQRKKDLGRIKVAFEEYFNDKGCYPGEIIVDQLSLAENCGKTIFSPWLGTWPCNPGGLPYKIVTEVSDCPKWFKAMTELENLNDSSIPVGWNTVQSYIIAQGITSKMVNYGVSSPNISWFDLIINPECLAGGCYARQGESICNSIEDAVGCRGLNCYRGLDLKNAACSQDCQVSCCGAGCN